MKIYTTLSSNLKQKQNIKKLQNLLFVYSEICTRILAIRLLILSEKNKIFVGKDQKEQK